MKQKVGFSFSVAFVCLTFEFELAYLSPSVKVSCFIFGLYMLHGLTRWLKNKAKAQLFTNEE